ncbi:MobC family plasmid mobilization relaxosome protein [Rhodopila sp.]|uniref:MobC family plasmid mobilization relaxosome protein n=1 Tax=Rhodopila sp. TaxID=2480087 RepID=UPI002C1C6698|nr:MobC family plasmid mobilization relaxosome protein [Rhodopila sp.]HVZ10140.1 MobC family plasmid mobilization relaxosome protein [Rhodopila sp.]
MTDAKPPPGRRKSEKRQRTAQLFVRLTPEEKAAFLDRADKAGMASAAFARAALAGDAGPRAQRRAPVNAQMLRQVLGHLGRVGNNLNQIARHLNRGRPDDMDEALLAALADYAHMRDMLYDALGKDPDRAPPAVISPSSVPPVSAAFNDSAAPPASSASDPPAAPAPHASPAPAEAPATPRKAAKPGSRFTQRPRP